MAAKKKKKAPEVRKLGRAIGTFYVRSDTPLCFNRMSQKVKQELLFPSRKVSNEALALRLKHDPVQEFRDTIYYSKDVRSPTKLVVPGTAFYEAIKAGSMDLEGAPSKAQIGRHIRVLGWNVAIYGIPEMWMTVVRQAGQNRTPDIRSRAIIRDWCAVVEVRWGTPVFNEKIIVNLFANAGITCGVGDGRVEKGTLDLGTWSLCDKGDEAFRAIVRDGGRKAQEAAMLRADPFDEETDELLSWFTDEATEREFEFTDREAAAPPKAARTKVRSKVRSKKKATRKAVSV